MTQTDIRSVLITGAETGSRSRPFRVLATNRILR
jgi:hypothetical protein